MKKISATYKDKKSAFFYAMKEAPIYDLIVGLTQKDYEESHNALIELIKYHLLEINIDTKSKVSILNLGCGTGKEALNILGLLENALMTCIDFSQEMLDVFQKKIVQSKKTNSIRLFNNDVLSINEYKEYLPEGYSSFDIIISAYTLHHYTIEEKKHIYSELYNALSPNGLFLNLDLSSLQSKTLSLVSQLQIEDWIISQFENMNKDLKVKLIEHGFEINHLKSDWLEHVKSINMPQILESQSINALENETDILTQIGYKEVGIPYRYFQSAVLWGIK